MSERTMSEYEEIHRVAEMMYQHGGGFVHRLGAALCAADRENARRIKAAFPEYWAQAAKRAAEE